ncbi:diaminopimelate epimerase [Gordonia jinhuaensis]|uniref:Diaminopimelate epimerase n=1 Tax=Gordonia jinhuaensis TaxID=1517702 RepID=A0A916T373_9ACTN|nr:diaminopimelate epimerase [Gordonia jinhuaensis]
MHEVRLDLVGSLQASGPEFVKAHGTENDFVVLPDLDVALDLSPVAVATLCDRRAGLGADGLLRVARAGALVAAGVLDELPAAVAADDWFMDYRNGDGSIAEMCGNGVRVFAHYLVASGLVSASEFTVGTRAGARPVHVWHADGHTADVTVEMGPVRLTGESKADVAGRTVAGVVVDVGNPHLACVVEGLDKPALDALVLPDVVAVDSDVFPAGANVEILTPVHEGAVDMRVVERGVGETRSCGTGIVAAAAAALRGADGAAPRAGALTVRVPGGVVDVEFSDGSATLRGPSRLVATGRLTAGWTTS